MSRTLNDEESRFAQVASTPTALQALLEESSNDFNAWRSLISRLTPYRTLLRSPGDEVDRALAPAGALHDQKPTALLNEGLYSFELAVAELR
jgi:hypothetical protein